MFLADCQAIILGCLLGAGIVAIAMAVDVLGGFGLVVVDPSYTCVRVAVK